MDAANYLDYLSVGETEVEYKIRGLSSNQQDARDILIICLQKESLLEKTVPQHSHIRTNPEIEAEYCQTKLNELNDQAKFLGVAPTADEVIPVYAKVIHWKGRCERLQNNFGNVRNIQSLANSFRRQKNSLRKLIIDNDKVAGHVGKDTADKFIFTPSANSSPHEEASGVENSRITGNPLLAARSSCKCSTK